MNTEVRPGIERRFCIAPMMDCSDRHARYFLRMFSGRMLLYTEMVTAAAIIHSMASPKTTVLPPLGRPVSAASAVMH